jgi:hypothetical protein
MFRLRLGIILIIVSWLPIAQVGIVIAHDHNKLWLAGKIAVQEAKEEGWRQSPKRLWHLFWNN